MSITTDNWTGTASADWGASSTNWSHGLPNSNSAVVINTKAVLTVSYGGSDGYDINRLTVGNDFFDMEQFPEIHFLSTSVEPVKAHQYRVNGDLTIKGVTKPISIDFEYTGAAVDPYQNQRVGFEGNVTVNRKDWGINRNAALEAGGVLVSENVVLEFEIAAVKKVS